MKLVEQGSGVCLAVDPTFVRWLAPDLLLDSVQRADTPERFGVKGVRARRMQFVILTSGVSPARCLDGTPGFVNRLVAAKMLCTGF
jgi:hypothetical protein